MWYAVVEQQREWMRAWRAATRHAFDVWPAATLPHAASTCYDDLFDPLLGQPAGPPRFDIAQPGVRDEVVAHTPFCELRRFTRADAHRAVLLCAPLAGHSAVMMRETVDTLLADGDVCVTDWLNARDVPVAQGRFGLDEYVAMLDGFVDALVHDDRPLHVVAVCQATVPALGALALRATRGMRQPASVTLIGGPLDARINPSVLGAAAASHTLGWCRRHLIDVVPPGFPGHGRHVFPTYLQQGEIALLYPQRFLSLIDDYARATARFDMPAFADARRALREYTALLDMPAEYFLDTVDVVFQRMCVANGTWAPGGTRVEPAALRDVVLLTVEGACDTVTGAGQTHAALDMCRGLADDQRVRLDIDGCDHYGLFTGAHWRGDVHPALQQVFAQAEHRRPRRRARRVRPT
ncbi:polyhydroxyalkanoate depolymerase [Burkholderia dolosa]|uniref:polyhydroxyalkanoate depolymerase n=1 Tax=Burkholderia dolosa TaxID=152500 RepID=UPI001B9006C7|nr:polyhydroxyalkanoate depolymerase [Burkholderia dolosa]MBR8314935.1 polyhydroxyalkanoate depolymerase [Burkholderia dolosa]